MRSVIFTGLVRTPELFLQVARSLAVEGAFDSMALCTWVGEVDRHLGLSRALRDLGVGIHEVPPIETDTWGNSIRQSLLLEAGLRQLPDDCVVVKLRPDLYVSARTVVGMASMVQSQPVIEEQPWAGRLRAPVVVPWWSPQVPFRLADEAFAGCAADLSMTNVQHAEVAALCPHMARWSAPFDSLHTWSVYREGSLAWRGGASAPLSLKGVRVLGQPRRRALQRAERMTHYEFLYEIANTAGAQVALADYHFMIGKVFRVYNPEPHTDFVLAAKGCPWDAVPGYRLAHCVADPLASRSHLLSYDDDPVKVAELVNSTPRNSAYRARWEALAADPHTINRQSEVDLGAARRSTLLKLAGGEYRESASRHLRRVKARVREAMTRTGH